MNILATQPTMAQVAVTTHHFDNARTGWNPHEPTLSYAAMTQPAAGQAFGLLQAVALDAQVDAQPLVAPNVAIVGDPNAGSHDVVFVATELNTVYAIDPTRGTVLSSRNFNSAVPHPIDCANSPTTVGINSTPVIDVATNSMYLITYTDSSLPTYTLHRVSLSDFSDIALPRIVAAAHPLDDGSRFNFNATYQHQRAALLLVNGAVYAGFASFCDFAANVSRGWLLGWRSDTLAPLEINSQPGIMVSLLLNTQVQNPEDYYLTSIWMSGAGPAADLTGNIYFVTGNSSPSGQIYNRGTNLQQSAVKFNPARNQVTSLLTPHNYAALEQDDIDFGSGGIIALPKSTTGLPLRLALAAGKDGWMFLMNRDSLGGFNGPDGPDRVIDRVQIGGCWCQPTYFEQAGIPTIVSSGGNTVQIWTLGGAGTPLVAGASATIESGQEGGFFTSLSSDHDADPIIWAVSRPLNDDPATVWLYAYAATSALGDPSLTQLYAAPAGNWPNTGGDAYIVPVVANGLVYVAANQRLSVFGLGGHAP